MASNCFVLASARLGITEGLMANWPLIVAASLFGAVIGSYLATIVMRWPRRESASGGRSRCDSCGEPLSALAMVPLVSWAVQGGRCARCQARIPLTHPAVELSGALICALSFIFVRDNVAEAFAAALLGLILLVLAVLDLKHMWLPDRLTAALAATGVSLNSLAIGPGWSGSLLGGIVGFASLWAIGMTYRRTRGREGLGGGDPKLFGAIGTWLGVQLLPLALLLASVVGLAVGIAMLLVRQHPEGPIKLPLGTLLCAAAWPVWVWAALNQGI